MIPPPVQDPTTVYRGRGAIAVVLQRELLHTDWPLHNPEWGCPRQSVQRTAADGVEW
jgi:hypothetical protein